MKKTTLATLATLVLIGCGGGGSDGASTSTSGTGGTGSTQAYKAYVPKTDNPNSFVCTTGTDTGFEIGEYMTEAECNTSAQAWLDAFNRNDAPSTAEQQAGLDWINTVRVGAGLPIFHHNVKLEKATDNHEKYLGNVYDTYNVNMTHYEDNNTYPSAFYTGVYPADRAQYEGYTGYYAGEVISFSNPALTPTNSLKVLMTMVYHRQALLWNYTNEIGIGGVPKNFGLHAQAHLMGEKSDRDIFLKAISADVVVYPYPNQTNVQTTFVAHSESPDPLPNITSNAGNPITVSFNGYYTTSVTLVSFKLYDDASNTEISNVQLMDQATDPNGRFGVYDFALFPLDPLDTNKTYRVEISYVKDGESKNKSWMFTTGA